MNIIIFFPHQTIDTAIFDFPSVYNALFSFVCRLNTEEYYVVDVPQIAHGLLQIIIVWHNLKKVLLSQAQMQNIPQDKPKTMLEDIINLQDLRNCEFIKDMGSSWFPPI